MPQSLLAFLAMMLATMASFNQQAVSIQVQEEMIRGELELMANAIALEAIETEAVPAGFAGLESFDQTESTGRFTKRNSQIDFTTSWSVRYVDSDGVGSATATDIREAVIEVSHPRYNSPLVVHRRLIGE